MPKLPGLEFGYGTANISFIDAGRTSGFSGAGAEEGAIIQETIGSQMALLGFFSGAEVAALPVQAVFLK